MDSPMSCHTTNIGLFLLLVIVAASVSGVSADCSQNCTQTVIVSSNKTLLTSPNYPSPYPDQCRCSWLILAPSPSYVVQIEIEDIQLQYDSECQADSLDIFNGGSTSSPRLAHLCDTAQIPDGRRIYYSSGPRMLVTFKSGVVIGQRLEKGFWIFCTAELASLAPTSGPATSSTTSSLPYGCSNETDTLRASSDPRTFYSPGYPGHYPRNIMCNWLIVANHGYVIELLVNDLQLEYDSLTVYDASYADSHRDIAGLCGPYLDIDFVPLRYESTGSYMYLSFKTDNRYEGRGFSVSFKQVPITGNQSSTAVQLQSNASMQILFSPGYPVSYPGNLQLDWLITADNGSVVHLTIYDLQIDLQIDQIEYEAFCDYESLSLYDSSFSTTAHMLATLCGSTNGRDYYSSGRYMYLYFETDTRDRRNGGRGFKVGYQSVNADSAPSNACVNSSLGGQSLNAVANISKYILSPNYPGQYPNNADCAWLIRAPFGYVVQLHVETMDLEIVVNCRFDAVTLFDSNYEDWPNKIAQLCGHGTADYYSHDAYMYVTFKSDSSGTRSGFRLTYNAVTPAQVPAQTLASSSGSSSNSAGLVAGIIIGSACAGILLVVCLMWRVKRQLVASGSRSPQLLSVTTRPTSHRQQAHLNSGFIFGPGDLGSAHAGAAQSPSREAAQDGGLNPNGYLNAQFYFCPAPPSYSDLFGTPAGPGSQDHSKGYGPHPLIPPPQPPASGSASQTSGSSASHTSGSASHTSGSASQASGGLLLVSQEVVRAPAAPPAPAAVGDTPVPSSIAALGPL